MRAWFVLPTQPNGSVVILLHGVRDSRLGMGGYGNWLVKNHYSVLLPDARPHGLSGGQLATYGLAESEDGTALPDSTYLMVNPGGDY